MELDGASERREVGIMILPPEVLVTVMRFLGPIDVTRVSSVCRLWHTISCDNEIWKQVWISHFPPPPQTNKFVRNN